MDYYDNCVKDRTIQHQKNKNKDKDEKQKRVLPN